MERLCFPVMLTVSGTISAPVLQCGSRRGPRLTTPGGACKDEFHIYHPFKTSLHANVDCGLQVSEMQVPVPGTGSRSAPRKSS